MLTPEFLKSLTDEFFQTLFDEFASQKQFGDLEPLACATTAASAKSKVEHHCLTHLPADPNCPICVQAKNFFLNQRLVSTRTPRSLR